MAVNIFEFIKNFRGQSQPAASKTNPSKAVSSYYEAHLPKISVSPSQYRDFVANKEQFQNMIDDWTSEENPEVRETIKEAYSSKYGFRNNPLFKMALSDLDAHDREQIEGTARRETTSDRRYFNELYRTELDDAEAIFNPFRRV